MAFTRRLFSAVTAAFLLAFPLFGCSSGSVTDKNGRLSIVCASFPEYDWMRQLLNGTDSTELTYLLGSGIDLHNYQPSVQDMVTIADCDIFVYTGGESESWADDALREARNKEMKAIRLFDIVGDAVKEEEIREGMEHEEDHHHDEPEYDEHVWLSVRNAETICGALCGALCDKDPANAETYRANLESYTAELKALDGEYKTMSDNAEVKTVLFGDRFPFRYLFDDYGIDYYAAFSGCSAETAASFETVAVLAQKLNELELDAVFIIENSDDSLAKSIIANSGRKGVSVETLNSVQSVTDRDVEQGITYLSIMKDNLETLKKVLD